MQPLSNCPFCFSKRTSQEKELLFYFLKNNCSSFVPRNNYPSRKTLPPSQNVFFIWGGQGWGIRFFFDTRNDYRKQSVDCHYLGQTPNQQSTI
jgi:hypothetical protein